MRSEGEGNPHRQKLLHDAPVGLQIGGGAGEADLALLQDVDAVGERHHELQVLLGQHDREARGLELGDALAQLLDDQWRQALRRLVEQQELGIAHQRAGDGQHLLLAAGQHAAAAVADLGQVGKEREHLLLAPGRAAVGADAAGDIEILPHRELGEDAPVFRHEADAEPTDAVRAHMGDVAALPHHTSAAGRREAHDRAHGRGLAHAIAPDQGDAFAGVYLQRDAEQHLAQAIGSVDALYLQVSHGHPRDRRA
jgi:hypothetical protein